MKLKVERDTVIRIGSLVILILILTLISSAISGCTQRLNEYLSWKQGVRGYPEFQYEVKGLVDAQEFYRHAWDGR